MTAAIASSPFASAAGPELHEIYDKLAAVGPIRRAVVPCGARVWLVTGYAAARAALAAPRLVKGRPQDSPFARWSTASPATPKTSCDSPPTPRSGSSTTKVNAIYDPRNCS